MTPERWVGVEVLFRPVLERPPAERSAFLEKACAGDPELLTEVKSLLGEHERVGNFLAEPALAAGAASEPWEAQKERPSAIFAAKHPTG